MACSSRNPQNCLAGANDYRTVDIPFPTIGEKITGDAWLGWYTTKNGGLTLAHATAAWLSPGHVRGRARVAAQGIPRRRGSDHSSGHERPFLLRRAGLQPRGGRGQRRSSSRDSSTTTTRKESPASRSHISARRWCSASAPLRSSPRRQGRGEKPSAVLAQRERESGSAPNGAAKSVRGKSASERGPTGSRRRRTAVEPSRWSTNHGWPSTSRERERQTCSIGGPGTGVPLQTFPGGNVYMAYALFDGPGEERGRIMFSRSTNCGLTWSAPRLLSRVQSADVNDDGVATTADVTRLQASLNRSCGQTGFNPAADVNNDCKVDVSRSRVRQSEASARPSPSNPDSRRAPRSRSIRRLARCRSPGVSSTTACCRTPSSPCAPPTAASSFVLAAALSPPSARSSKARPTRRSGRTRSRR